MRRFKNVIRTCVVHAMLPAVVSYGGVQPSQFDAVPVADFPAGTPADQVSTDIGVAASPEELPDAETLSPPTELPLTKESLDAAAPAQERFPARQTQQTGVPGISEPEMFLSPTQGPATPTQSPSTPTFGSPRSVYESPDAAFDLPVPDSTSTDEFGVLELPPSNLGDSVLGDSVLGDSVLGDSVLRDSVLGDSVLGAPSLGDYGAEPVYADAVDAGSVYEDTTFLGDITLPAESGPYGGGWDFGGWLSGGTTYNADGNRTSNGNAPLGFNNYADGLLLNQAWMYLAKETQTGGHGWDWGFRIDFMFGADGPDTQVRRADSWDATWDTGGQYGFAMPQFYGEIAYNRTKTKFGHFYTILGYEVVQAPYNFFYSHSYSRYYNQPFTHTGFLTQYNLKPDLTLFGGWTAGWDSGFENRNNGSTFLGGAIWNVSDRFDVMYSATVGDPGDVPVGSSDVYMHSLIGDFKFGYGWNYVLQWDYQSLQSAGGPRTDSNALNQYLFKQLRHNLSVGTRMEYFRDEDGARIGNGPGDYYETTFGVNWRPLSRMVLRPEIRWDWFEGAGLPYDNNTSRSLFTVGMDAVYVF